MPHQDDAWLRHQQTRWLRPDGDRWVRPDAARFLKPGSNLVEVFPALAFKYSPNQPRVPAGHPDGGQWTSGGGGEVSDFADPIGSTQPSYALPMGDVAIGDVAVGSDDLFSIVSKQPERTGVRLAGDLPEGSDPAPEVPTEPPPEIPAKKPRTSAERTAILRAVENWAVRHAGLPAKMLFGAIENIEWLKDRTDLIRAATDPPKSLLELQNEVGRKRAGYDVHHIVERTWAEYFGFSRSQVNDRSNLVSIPRLKHWQITGWYMTRTDEFGGLSPRD
ncbi:hypothetical protein ACTZWT_10285 [Rhodopseudomonas sp. NSM]|uniref:hypothetical protein n=1 Tax=Rhodopseudomonas sp. NSM TaxID=3457630 RepID=UPI0040353D2E